MMGERWVVLSPEKELVRPPADHEVKLNLITGDDPQIWITFLNKGSAQYSIRVAPEYADSLGIALRQAVASLTGLSE